MTWCAWCGDDLTPKQVAYSAKYRGKSGNRYCKLQCYREHVHSRAPHFGKSCKRCEKPLRKDQTEYCSRRCWSLHYNEPRRKPIAREQIEKLYVFGRKSKRAVARELGCSIFCVSKAMRQFGIEARERTGGWKVPFRRSSSLSRA